MRWNTLCTLAAVVALAAACSDSYGGGDDNDPGQNNNNAGNDNNNNGNNNGNGNDNPGPVCVADAPLCEGTGPNNGCDEGQFCNAICQCQAEIAPPPADILARPSRTTAVDITKDDGVVIMVNSDEGSVSFFNAAEGQESRFARISSSNQTTNSEPVAVVIHPDQNTAFVANRATGSVSKIINIATLSPQIVDERVFGGEVMGIALTPSGAELWVTNWTLGTVTVLDTSTFQIERTISLPGHPFAIAISNDGDDEDGDEKVVVTDFFARKIPGEVSEAVDGGRNGRVFFLDVAGGAPRESLLPPIEDCFTANIDGEPVGSGCIQNQLNSVTIHTAFGRTYAYVTSVAASPAGPVNFNLNVQAVIAVISMATEQFRPDLSHNLNSFIAPQGEGRFFMNVPNSIAFVNNPDINVGYVTSAASNMVLRVEWKADDSFSIGAPQALNIPVGQNPLGIQIRHVVSDTAAFTANLISRNLSVLSFRDQEQVKTVESTTVPSEGTDAFDIWNGKRFFNTSVAIWSAEGWGSCQGCHPMGLTDNITWSFAAGPRQTIALDGQFASNDSNDMRALNWTAIFDESADFENNTRGVSGGAGAIQNGEGPINSGPGVPPFSNIVVENGETENHQALNGSLNFVIANPDICSNANTCPDWQQIDRYIQTIRSPNGRDPEASLVAQGRALFDDGGCAKCHAGPKWTISRTFYTPEQFSGDLPPNREFEANRLFNVEKTLTLVGLPLDVNVDDTLIAGDDSDGGAPAFRRMACNLRRVGTFGTEGGAAELRANNGPAQGQNGFNPPSLLGGVIGAPFMHNGSAADLEDLFDARFEAHTRAGNPNFAPNASQREALIAFLESLDEDTVPFDIEDGTLLCPDLVSPQ